MFTSPQVGFSATSKGGTLIVFRKSFVLVLASSAIVLDAKAVSSSLSFGFSVWAALLGVVMMSVGISSSSSPSSAPSFFFVVTTGLDAGAPEEFGSELSSSRGALGLLIREASLDLGRSAPSWKVDLIFMMDSEGSGSTKIREVSRCHQMLEKRGWKKQAQKGDASD